MSEQAVLIVEDEPDLRELYRTYLNDEYAVRTAASGRDALDQLDETVVVTLLDRRMPGMSGDEVLEAIRECGYDCRVAMLTAVEPDFDIIEMGFDDYITKPVGITDLTECIEALIRRQEYDDHLQEYYAVASKIATLETRKPAEELAESEEFQSLKARLDELETQADAVAEKAFETNTVDQLFQEVS